MANLFLQFGLKNRYQFVWLNYDTFNSQLMTSFDSAMQLIPSPRHHLIDHQLQSELSVCLTPYYCSEALAASGNVTVIVVPTPR